MGLKLANVFKIETKIIKNQSEVKKSFYNNADVYRVSYTKETLYNVFLFGKCIISKMIKRFEQSDIDFDSQVLAELYAKNTYQADFEDDKCYNNYICFINGSEQFNKYGKFTCYIGNSKKPEIFFDFNSFYKEKFGRNIYCGKMENVFQDLPTLYKGLKSKICPKQNNIVSRFDIVTMQNLPIDEINASSEEMIELKRLIEQWHKDKNAYQEFLQKLLKNKDN